jgi:hypothetical protein
MATTGVAVTGPRESDTKKQFGAHQSYHPLSFQVDRTNLFVGRVEMHAMEDWDGANQEFLSLNFGDGTVAASAGINNLATSGKGAPRCVGVERRYDDALGMGIYTYTFEGIASRHDKKFYEFELEFTMEQRPIETHPNFQKLEDTFGPYDSLNRLWPRIVTEKSAATAPGLSKPKSGGPVTNPMYGQTSFISPGCVYRRSYTTVDLESKVMEDIGTIVVPPAIDSAFAQFNSFITKNSPQRNWLKMNPKIRQRGGCISVIEEYLLSGPLGWFPAMYNKEALTVQVL